MDSWEILPVGGRGSAGCVRITSGRTSGVTSGRGCWGGGEGGGENRWDLPVNMKWKPSARFGSQDRGRIGVGSGDK